MKRTYQQWIDCNPKVMAQEMSQAAQQFAFEDAKADILYLAHENLMMKDILREIAYPRRGTVECENSIQDYANYIQANYTLEELETTP
jgi:hypothetical protein